MQKNIKISVIIPVYNSEKFLSKCLEHLIHQTYYNLEIIIVDDGSTDNVANVYNKYAESDNRIIVYKQKNSGPSVARNIGIQLATGDYLHFHDSDDFVNLDYYEIMADAAIKTDADILCGEVNQPDYNFPVFDSIEICLSMQDKILKTRANLFNPAWRYLYKKSFIDNKNLRFEESLKIAEDMIFTKTSIIMAKYLATVPNAIYNVINTPNSLGKTQGEHIKVNKEDTKNSWIKFHKFLYQTGADTFINIKEMPFNTEVFKICNIKIFEKEIFIKKIRYYLFGINIGTKHFRP